jgi:hexosaminidase
MIDKKLTYTFSKMILIAVMAIQVSCSKRAPSDLSKEIIIPRPVSVTATGDYFTINEATGIYVQGETDEEKNIGQLLADILKPSTGFGLEVNLTSEAPEKGNIVLMLSTEAQHGDEGYELSITEDQLTLIAGKPAGLFRGIQTIRQLLPVKVELASKQEGPWEIPTGKIVDQPEYEYRGAMLDVARHFFSVNDVKKFIDYLSFYKLNALHLHLSDDQGWRIEIKSWPNLTAIGGSSEVGGGEGGFFTQDQYSEIVRYARDRYIMVVPEIDMPGHTNAALASYAELNCSGKATKLYTGIEVGFSTLCVRKEITYKFIDDVMRELAAITPGPYLHLGGDESHVTKKEDYIYLVDKVQEIVESHGKLAMGWDEISLSTLKPNTVAQYWSNAENAARAVKQGAKLLMSPAKQAYVDMKYDSTTTLGQHWAAYIEVDSAYIWDPAKMVPGIGKENILGVEAALWTETITNMDELEYMVFPRLAGIAEVGWTPSDLRSWDEYKIRLGKHGERMRALDINYYPSSLIQWSAAPL